MSDFDDIADEDVISVYQWCIKCHKKFIPCKIDKDNKLCPTCSAKTKSKPKR